MAELPIIEFEGKKVSAKKGVYRCPYRCGSVGYPQPKWKTEKGFRDHMTKCPKRPSLLLRQSENKEIELSAFETLKAEVLNSLEYKINDVVAVVKETIIKPTHEQRGSRMVRVRYEAVKRFEGVLIRIVSFDFVERTYLKTADEVKMGCLFINKNYSLSSICKDIDEAKSKASKMQKSYDDACSFASQCR